MTLDLPQADAHVVDLADPLLATAERHQLAHPLDAVDQVRVHGAVLLACLTGQAIAPTASHDWQGNHQDEHRQQDQGRW